MNMTNQQSTKSIIDKLLTAEEATEQLALKNKNTLGVWRATKRYDLAFVKIGRSVRYRESDIQKFIDRNVYGESRDG